MRFNILANASAFISDLVMISVLSYGLAEFTLTDTGRDVSAWLRWVMGRPPKPDLGRQARLNRLALARRHKN